MSRVLLTRLYHLRRTDHQPVHLPPAEMPTLMSGLGKVKLEVNENDFAAVDHNGSKQPLAYHNVVVSTREEKAIVRKCDLHYACPNVLVHVCPIDGE